MANLDCCFLTFNCARVLLDVSYFADCLYHALSKRDSPPDLLIVALQEIAPIGIAFLGGSFLTPYFKKFDAAVDEATEKWGGNATRYENVLTTNAGMTGIMLFAQPDIAPSITKVMTGGVGVGDYDLGNKGAVGIRIGYAQGGEEETEITFLAAHLAPSEVACERRNQDWKAIIENLVFKKVTRGGHKDKKIRVGGPEAEPLLSSATDDHTDGQLKGDEEGLYKQTSHFFLAGDLNYRSSDTSPHPDDHKSWPRPSDTASANNEYKAMFRNDQLSREMKAGRTLHNLHEAPIDFAPTYKYSSKAQELAAVLAAKKANDNSSSLSASPKLADAEQWLWAKHRTPSWCDRVLYLIPPFYGTQPDTHGYISLPLQPSSDHQPVLLQFSVPLKPLPKEDWLERPYAIKADWRERRTAARRREVVVGVVAYLTMTWEGRALLLGTVVGTAGGYAMLRSLLT